MTSQLIKRDKTLGAMIIANLVFPLIEAYTQVMKHYQFTTLSALEVLSTLWMPDGNWYLGILAGVGIGSWTGLLAYYSYKIWGIKHFPLKIMLLTMTLESFVFIIFGVLGRNAYSIQDLSGNLVHASAAALGGLLTGYFIRKYLF